MNYVYEFNIGTGPSLMLEEYFYNALIRAHEHVEITHKAILTDANYEITLEASINNTSDINQTKQYVAVIRQVKGGTQFELLIDLFGEEVTGVILTKEISDAPKKFLSHIINRCLAEIKLGCTKLL